MKYLFSLAAGWFLLAGISFGQKQIKVRTDNRVKTFRTVSSRYTTPFLYVTETGSFQTLSNPSPTTKPKNSLLAKRSGNPTSASPSLRLNDVKSYPDKAKAKITLDVQIDWGDATGYRILLDADHNTYGRVIPPDFWLCEGDVPESTMAEFEATVPENATGLLDDSTWVFPYEKISVEIEPGIYDYAVINPSDAKGICYIASGAASRGDDFVFQAGNEYIFTLVLDIPHDNCILTADCQTDIAATNIKWPQTAVDLTDAETIKAEVTNTGKLPIESFTISYSIDEGTSIEETVTHTIAPGENYIHTFKTPADLSEEKAYHIAITANTENDGLNNNNRTGKTIYHVQAVPAPFVSGFDTDADMNKWISINTNQDDYTWQWGPYNEFDPSPTGEISDGGFATMATYTEQTGEDWLVTFSPVTLAKGEAHIRFYYSGAFSMSPEHLQVWYGNSSDVNKMTLLQDFDNIQSSAWNFSALNINIEDTGDYYFAFLAISGPMSAQIKIDEIAIEEGRFVGTPDLSINFIDLPISSCGLTDCEKAGVNITNTGTGDITKFSLSYSIDNAQAVTETFTDTIPMGLTKTIWLTDKFDFSTVDKTYKVKVEGTVIAQEGEKDEAASTLEDNVFEWNVTHFSPADLPFQTDWNTAEGQSQWGCKYATWAFDEESRSLFALNKSPLVSRCMNLKADQPYRITYYVTAMFENYDIVCGLTGTPIEEWDTIASYRDIFKEDFQTPEEIEFGCKTDGTYSIAILPGNENSWVYLMQTFTVAEIAEHDIRITDFTTSLGRLTPVRFAANPSFDIQVENRGTSDETGVKVELKNNGKLLASSEPVSLKKGEIRTIPVSGSMEIPVIGSTVQFDLTTLMETTDSHMEDNTQSFSFEATDTEYAFDQTGETPSTGLLNYDAYAIGHIFTLTETDTLTAVKFGCTTSEYDFPLGVAIYPIDTTTGKPGTAITEQKTMRGKDTGFRTIEIPACLLSPGSYFIALRQYTSISHGMSLVACDADPNGYFYMTPRRDSALIRIVSLDGTVAVRAIFGHDAEVIARDIAVVSIDKPADKDIFTENETIEITLKNNGFEDITDIKVTCFVNGKSQEKIIEMAGYETAKVSFTANMLTPGYYEIRISVAAVGDEVETNNALVKTVRCIGIDPYAMDFEFCEDFAIDNFTPAWTTVDADGGETSGFQDATFPHENDPYAFMAFNPAETEPASPLSANNGKRFGACFASYAEQNDDWLISPNLTIPTQNPQLKFFVQSYVPDYGLEKYNVLISTTNNDPESFVQIGGTREAPAYTWTEVKVDLKDYAGKSAWVAIQCVSKDAFIFMIDDIEITGSMDTTGNEQAANLPSHIRAYPNPASDRWTVTAYGLKIHRVEIFNTVGASVYRSNEGLSTDTYRLNVQNFQTGLYIARIHTNAGIQSVKLIVKRK